MIPITENIIIANAKGIQIGDNTHNQDQSITPVNFSAINRIASNPVNPIPPLLPLLVPDNINHPPIKSLTETNFTPPSPCGSNSMSIT